MIGSRIRPNPLLIVAVIGLAFVGVGCGDSSQDSIEKAIAEQTGGSVDLDIGDDGLSMQTEDGDLTVGEDGNFAVTDENGDVLTGEGDGDGNFSVEGDDGSFSVSQGSEIPEEWPGDVPKPVDLAVASSSVIDTPDGTAVTVTGTVEDAATFVDLYGGALEATGFTDEGRADSDGSISAVMSNPTWNITIATTSIDGQNQVNVSLFPAT